MPPISLLIKPASGKCNLRCRYCFYSDEMSHRDVAEYGNMSEATLEKLIKKTFEKADSLVTLGFQGGEPLLRGLDFYKKLCELTDKHNVKKLPVQMTIQTNGTLVDNEWAEFLAEKKFLVGLSLDGPRSIHDRFRLDAKNEGTFKNVLKAAGILKEAKAEFNILTVLTEQSAREIDRVYKFLVSKGLYYHQYIPCLNPLDGSSYEASLTTETYGKALKTLFDLWFEDVKNGVPVYNRYFENLIGMLMGRPPESCDMVGHCSIQYLVEADGSVYPCDFYALDEYKLGNINEDSFEIIDANRTKIEFIEKSMIGNNKCYSCKWKNLCRGGCRRNRPLNDMGELGLNQFCSAYQEFFDYAIDRMMLIARTVK